MKPAFACSALMFFLSAGIANAAEPLRQRGAAGSAVRPVAIGVPNP